MSETDARLDLGELRAIIRNPHAYPMSMITEGLEHAINELENARTTIAQDLEYQRKIELTLAKTLSRLANHEPLEAHYE